MLYKINAMIAATGRAQLIKAIGQSISKVISYDATTSVSLKILMETKGEKTAITNKTDVKSDGDEYPSFLIRAQEESEFYKASMCKTYDIGCLVKGVDIVTDHVVWEWRGRSWDVESDIAVIFGFDDGTQLLIQIIDSIAGLLRYYKGNDCIGHLCGIDGQWAMKTDVLLEKQRTVKCLGIEGEKK